MRGSLAAHLQGRKLWNGGTPGGAEVVNDADFRLWLIEAGPLLIK